MGKEVHLRLASNIVGAGGAIERQMDRCQLDTWSEISKGPSETGALPPEFHPKMRKFAVIGWKG